MIVLSDFYNGIHVRPIYVVTEKCLGIISHIYMRISPEQCTKFPTSGIFLRRYTWTILQSSGFEFPELLGKLLNI